MGPGGKENLCNISIKTINTPPLSQADLSMSESQVSTDWVQRIGNIYSQKVPHFLMHRLSVPTVEFSIPIQNPITIWLIIFWKQWEWNESLFSNS